MYQSLGDAKRVLKRIEQQKKRNPKRKALRAKSLSPYRCAYCGHYHLGRNEK